MSADTPRPAAGAARAEPSIEQVVIGLEWAACMANARYSEMVMGGATPLDLLNLATMLRALTVEYPALRAEVAALREHREADFNEYRETSRSTYATLRSQRDDALAELTETRARLAALREQLAVASSRHSAVHELSSPAASAERSEPTP